MRAPPTHFFRFISPAPESQLSIPKSFRKYLKGNRNKNALLRRGSRKWPVKVNDDWSFGEGWEKFSQENGVEDFDFVSFKHEGNMVFEIIVFDTSMCEREYPADQVVNTEAVDSDKSHHTTRIHASIKITKEKAAGVEGTRNASGSGNYPYFKGTVTRSISIHSILNVPMAFARSNGLNNRNCEMLVRDEKDTLWPVKLRKGGKHHVRIKGLKDFKIANDLTEGDDFLLELVENGDKPLMNFQQASTKIKKKKAAGIERTRNAPRFGDYEYFKGTVTRSISIHSMLNVPIAFARSNGLDNRNCEMLMRDEEERLWPVKLRKSDDCHVRIKGLHDFKLANGLKEGDDFLVELVENGNKPLMNFRTWGIEGNPERKGCSQ